MPTGIPSLPPHARASDAEDAAGQSIAPSDYGVPRRRGASLATWFAVVAAFALGATVTYVFVPPQVKEVVRVVEAPTSVPRAPVAPPPPPPPQQEAKAATDDPATTAGQRGRAAVGPRGAAHVGNSASKANPPAPSSEPKRAGLLSDVGLHGAAPGPTRAEPEASAAVASLDSGAVARTVSRYSPAVRRSCWQQALNARAGSAPSSARVMVTIHVAPAGRVQDVRTSGDPPGYAGLARCIEGKVRSWNFPRAEGPTIANVPFVFAAQ